ncbi:MAG: aminotransferase class V-fold PLP-dependent enzyme [bacterium]|nr:aminotransferase class V-fold PLP-dependent enzyme [Gammaproteobacteria bacterium]
MKDDDQLLQVDSRFEDCFDDRFEERLEKKGPLTRRGFLGQTFAAVTAGTLSLGATGKATAAPQPTSGQSPDASPDNEAYWRWVANQFMLKPGLAYMNTGTRGPSPTSVYQAQIQAIRESNEDRLSYARYAYNSDFKAQVRNKLASFVGCKSNELALTNNTTEGMAIGTNGPSLQAGDEIIYTNHDHSGGAQPINLRCARENTRAVVVDLSAKKYHPPKNPDLILDAIEAAITPRTKLISICHINYGDGLMLPVKEICAMARAKGILTLVDGAHPPGMLALNLHDLGCDMYAGACHKWMLAAQLTGFFYVREELQDRIWPSIYSGPVLGKNMYGAPDDSERGTTAQRYESHGSINYAAGVSINAAIDFHNSIGQEAIEARDRYLANRARNAFRDMDGVEVFSSDDQRLSAGLVAFKITAVETKVLADLLWDRHQIYIRNVTHAEIDWDANRASLHIMVTSAQLDNLLGAVEEIARKGFS